MDDRFQFDVTVNGRVFKLCNNVDDYTREALAIHVDRNIDADTTVAVLDKIAAERGRHPVFIRCDNGPELTAHALRDWCRFGGTGSHPARRGRTRSSSRSTRGCATNASPQSSSTHSWMPKWSSRTEDRPQLQPAALGAGHARPADYAAQQNPPKLS